MDGFTRIGLKHGSRGNVQIHTDWIARKGEWRFFQTLFEGCFNLATISICTQAEKMGALGAKPARFDKSYRFV